MGQSQGPRQSGTDSGILEGRCPIGQQQVRVKNSMTRPEHLPDFLTPPLHEVVLGVQFSPPRGYQQILAGEVWGLYRAEYPTVEERPALEPMFETFGLPSSPTKLKIFQGPTHDRFWFVKKGGEELIQFQSDRLLHNWRRIGDGTNEYPRFEKMAERFEGELVKLEQYVASLSKDSLHITQCEITYVNRITAQPAEPLVADDWLRPLSFQRSEKTERFSLTFGEVIRDDSARPQGRLIVETASGTTDDGTPMIGLNITVRGAPKEATIRSAKDFLVLGRELIVTRFAELTTDSAHKRWGRV